MSIKTFRILILSILACQAALADQVTMKNGDRLSGTILRYDGEKLVMKSDFAGEVTIPWEAVTAVTSDTPLYVGLKDGQVVVGTVGMAGGQVAIVTSEAAKVQAARETVDFIRTKEAHEAYLLEMDRYRNPRIVDLWQGYVDFGYARAQGNAITSNINVGAQANRETTRDKISVRFTSIYSSNDTAGQSIVTANAIRGGFGYNLNINKKSYAFASADLEFDEFQSLDLRFVPAGGFGYRIHKSERATFDFLGGASLNREFFSTGLSRSSGEALLSEEFSYRFNERTSISQKFTIYPNLTDPGSYRMNWDSSISTNILRWLAWQGTLSDRFLSNPVPGRKQNDWLFTTGIRMSFKK